MQMIFGIGYFLIRRIMKLKLASSFFQLKQDYSQWDFRVGELSGFILQRWNGKSQ